MQPEPLTLLRVVRRMETVASTSTLTVSSTSGQTVHRFGEIAQRVRVLASALVENGVKPGDRVVTMAFNTREHLELFLAVPLAGAVLQPVNPRLSASQISYILDHGGARIAFVDSSIESDLLGLVSAAASIRQVVRLGDGVADEYEAFVSTGSASSVLPELNEQWASGLFYTSGTTGHPKGVLYSHRSTLLHAIGTCLVDGYGISQHETVLPIVPLFHANAWGLPHAAGLTGANLVLPGRDASGAATSELVRSAEVTMLAAVPTVLAEMLVYAGTNPGVLSSLRTIVSGGAPLPLKLVKSFAADHGVEVIQGWGMTETSPNVAMSWPPSRNAGLLDPDEYRIQAGRMNMLADARIMSPDGVELPWDGVAAGEIQLRSPHAAVAYYENPEASAELLDGAWLRTGDLASIDPSGRVHLRDRIKDLVKSGGEWIPTVELEAHISSHPDVEDAAVVAIVDERWGERPLAWLVMRAGATLDPDSIRAHLLELVPRWWVPEQYRVVDSLPLTPAGKVDKKALRERPAN